jgi:hypothetical protein
VFISYNEIKKLAKIEKILKIERWKRKQLNDRFGG